MRKSTSIPRSAPHGRIPAHYSQSDAALLKAIARQQSELIVDEYLQSVPRYPHSPEYRLGMIDAVCRQLSGVEAPPRFAHGTAQDDAHWAGIEHGAGLLSLLEAEEKAILKALAELEGL